MRVGWSRGKNRGRSTGNAEKGKERVRQLKVETPFWLSQNVGYMKLGTTILLEIKAVERGTKESRTSLLSPGV